MDEGEIRRLYDKIPRRIKKRYGLDFEYFFKRASYDYHKKGLERKETNFNLLQMIDEGGIELMAKQNVKYKSLILYWLRPLKDVRTSLEHKKEIAAYIKGMDNESPVESEEYQRIENLKQIAARIYDNLCELEKHI